MPSYISPTLTWPNSVTNPTTAQKSAYLHGLRNACVSVGLVQTADTGQMDPDNPPDAIAWGNATPKYFVFRFDDALHSTAPLYFKLAVGTGNNNQRIDADYTIGTGSNGAGTLTDSITINCGYQSDPGTGPLNVVGSYVDGAFFLGNMLGWTGSRFFSSYISIERTRDELYTLTGDGCSVLAGPIYSTSNATSAYIGAIRFASPVTAYPFSRSFLVIPGDPGSSQLLDGTYQLYPHFYNLPDCRQRWSSFTVRTPDFPYTPTKFLAAPWASQSRQFIWWGRGSGTVGPVVCHPTYDANYGPCFAWED